MLCRSVNQPYNVSHTNCSHTIIGITTVIFLPAVKYLGSDEQYEEWEAKSRRGEIIGAYASTELGGGTPLPVNYIISAER